MLSYFERLLLYDSIRLCERNHNEDQRRELQHNYLKYSDTPRY